MFAHFSGLISSLVELPLEIQLKILDYVSIEDQYSALTTCKNLSVCYDFIIEKNETYKDKRDFKRFSHYFALNHYYVETRSNARINFNLYHSLDFNNFVSKIPSMPLYYTQIITDIMLLALSQKFEFLKYLFWCSFVINPLNDLYTSIMTRRIKNEDKDPGVSGKYQSLTPTQETEKKFKLIQLVPVALCITEAFWEMAHKYLDVFTFFNCVRFFIYSLKFFDSGLSNVNYSATYSKTNDFIQKYVHTKQYTKIYFYPYTEKGRKFVLGMKVGQIFFSISQWLSLLYILYGLYKQHFFNLVTWKIKKTRKKGFRNFKTITSELKTYNNCRQTFSLLESSSLILKYYFDHCIKK